MASIEIFCSYYVNKIKTCLVISKMPAKMAITLELKLCRSNFRRRIER